VTAEARRRLGERVTAAGGAVLIAAPFLPWDSDSRGYELNAAGLYGITCIAGGVALLLAGVVPAIAASPVTRRLRRTALAAASWSALSWNGAMVFADGGRAAVYGGLAGGLIACAGTTFCSHGEPPAPPSPRVTLGDGRGVAMVAGAVALIASTTMDWWAFWGPWERSVYGLTGPILVLVGLLAIAVPAMETFDRRTTQPLPGIAVSPRQAVWTIAAATAVWPLSQWFRDGSRTGTIVALVGAVTITIAASSPAPRET